MDYGLLGQRDSEQQVSPVLVIRERRQKMTRAMLVPRKGAEFSWIVKRAAKFIDQLGHSRVTLRCDNGPATEALAREVAQARQEGSQTVPERPPAGWRQSSGIIERAVGPVAGQARTLKDALEHRICTRVPPGARTLCWTVAFAACQMNRCDVVSDGKTSLQRLHARKDNTPILEFGEKILYVPAKPATGGKLGTAIPSWSVCWHAELVVRDSGCRRARAGEQDTRSDRQENPPSRRDGTRTEYSECEPFHGLWMAVTMHSISKSEWRGPRRWCLALLEKC